MKKKYEAPKVEKYEFNYVENVTASGLRTDDGEPITEDIVVVKDNALKTNKCFSGKNSFVENCTLKE